MEYAEVSTIEHCQPEGIKLKMRRHILRSGIYWQWALKQKGLKQVGHKIRAVCTYLWIMFCSRRLHDIVKPTTFLHVYRHGNNLVPNVFLIINIQFALLILHCGVLCLLVICAS